MEILSIDTPDKFAAAARRATELLRRGELVAMPTETVYGLAGNAWNAEAVGRIFEVKGRPSGNPIIVHVSSVEMARECVAQWPHLAAKLGAAFWPGPLTMVLPRSEHIPLCVTAGGPAVGIRWPNHPFMTMTIKMCGFPLAAPSANPSNRLSPTNAEHVRKSLENKVPLLIDGGQSQVGIESTVIDLTANPPRLLRPGMIQPESIAAVTGPLQTPTETSGTLRSPGMLPKHYAPRAKLVVLNWLNEANLAAHLLSFHVPREKIHIVAHTHIPLREKFGRVALIPHDPEAYARALYAELHQCDDHGAELIVVEDVPEKGPWRSIADRLRRAAS